MVVLDLDGGGQQAQGIAYSFEIRRGYVQQGVHGASERLEVKPEMQTLTHGGVVP